MQGVGALLFGIEARRFVLGLLELYRGVIGVILGLYWGYTMVLLLVFGFKRFFPTLAVGLLDFKVDVVLARLEADFSDQPPSIRAVPNRRVSVQCPTAEYLCSAEPPSIPAVPHHQVSLQCPTGEYPCSAQLTGIPAVPHHQVSLQCPTAECPCSAQRQSIPAVPQSIRAVPNRRVSLQCPTTKYSCSAQPQSIPGVPNSRVSIVLQRICRAARKTVEGGGGGGAGKHYTSCAITALGWGCSK